MRRSKTTRPQVEGLESLVFLSVTPTRPMATQAAIGRQQVGPTARPTADLGNLDLSGTIRGNYKLHLAPDGSSGTFQIQGVGSARGLGPARLATLYTADGESAPETMTMTLTGRRGTVTLLVGRAPGDVDPDPSTARLRYQVLEGTGGLAGAGGGGVVDLTLRPQLRSLGTAGQVTVTLRPDAA